MRGHVRVGGVGGKGCPSDGRTWPLRPPHARLAPKLLHDLEGEGRELVHILPHVLFLRLLCLWLLVASLVPLGAALLLLLAPSSGLSFDQGRFRQRHWLKLGRSSGSASGSGIILWCWLCHGRTVFVECVGGVV